MDTENKDLKKAREFLEKAEQIIGKSYAWSGECKLFIPALENLDEAWKSACTGMKEKEKKKYSKEMQTFKQIEDLRRAQKQSPVEFIREKKLVICSEAYKTRIIDETRMKQYIKETQKFLDNLEANKNA